MATAIAAGDNTMESAGLLAMPLDRFVEEGQLVEVRVPWLEVTLWFVSEERDAEMLGREGVARGRVWTARELMAVMACRVAHYQSSWVSHGRSTRSMGPSSTSGPSRSPLTSKT